MMPVIPNNLKHYTGTSPAYTGSSPYATPEQPPFYELTRTPRRHSPPCSPPTTPSRPAFSTRSPRSYSTSSSSRKSSLFSLRSNSASTSGNNLRRSSSSLLGNHNGGDSISRHSSTDSTTSSTLSISNIKSLFRGSGLTREEKAARKVEKERKKMVERAEREAYERAHEMEASALYMAWRYGDGPNTESYCLF